MRRLDFAGTAREIGEAFGEVCRSEIEELYHLRVRNALAQAKEFGGRTVSEGTLLEVSRRCVPLSERYDPEGHAELWGIARGSRLSLEQIFAMNGLTDLRDVLAFGEVSAWGGREIDWPPVEEGCSSFIVQGDLTVDGNLLLGQTWDLATDNMPYVVAVHRKPDGRPETWSMTTVGCLSLIGLNSEGIGIGTTNIRTTDSRLGVSYLQIIHHALSKTTRSDAVRAIVEAPRAGAHYYAVADATGGASGVECTATRCSEIAVARGYYVHCNHVLVDEQKPLEAAGMQLTSSLCRQSRMAHLIVSQAGEVDIERAKRFLADHEGGEDAICRHDCRGISSNGSVVISPATGRLVACHGPACAASWSEITSPA